VITKTSAALLAVICATGAAHAQTTTLIDTQLNVPTYLSSTSSFTVPASGSLFIEGASTLSPTVEGVGILEQGNTIVDTFALTNGTVGSPVFNEIKLVSAGVYSFLYDFANSNSTIGGSVHLTANVTSMMAPEIDPSSAMTALTLLFGGLATLRPRQNGKSAV